MAVEMFWLMVTVAVGGGISIPILAIWTKHRKEIAQLEVEATARNTGEKAAQYAAQNREMEDRLRVLERIITDKGYDVATQIEALRDQRRVEDQLEEQAKIEPGREQTVN